MIRIQAILLLILTFLTAFPAHAEWGRTAHDYLDLPLPRGVSLCADGNGGCWATSGGVNSCHVDRFGNFTWGDERFRILPEPGYNPKMVLAENGDLILAMDIPYDEETGRVYLQRVNLDREFIWGEEGIQLDSSDENQGVFGVYAGPIDNTYLIHWARLTDFGIPVDGRLQLINEEGDFLWGNTGIGENEYYYSSKIVKTSDHCVIVARSLLVNDVEDTQVTKIDSDGGQLWDLKFSLLGEDLWRERSRASESDRAGGVILVYEYQRNVTIYDTLRIYFGVNVMRISGDGDSLWTRQVYEFERGQRGQFGEIQPIINYAGSGRFFVAWADQPRTFQVVALNVDGDLIWEEPLDIALNPGGYAGLEAVDSDSGLCYTWSGGDPDIGIIPGHYGQRISLNRERLWGESGRAIQARSVWDTSITTNGNGGVITVVEPGPTIQMINRNGEIGIVLEVGVDDEIEKQKPSKLFPQLNIYPNPGNSMTTISFDTPAGQNMMLKFYDVRGRLLFDDLIHPGALTHPLDISALPSGSYMLQLQSGATESFQTLNIIK